MCIVGGCVGLAEHLWGVCMSGWTGFHGRVYQVLGHNSAWFEHRFDRAAKGEKLSKHTFVTLVTFGPVWCHQITGAGGRVVDEVFERRLQQAF